MEGESSVTRSSINKLHFWDVHEDQTEGERMVLLKVSLMNLILGKSNWIKWKVQVVVLEVSLMNFILRISKEVKWKVKMVLQEVSFMNFVLRISKEIK